MPARRRAAATPGKKSRDWFDYIGPVITSVVGAAVILFVTKSCANSEGTHAAVTHLTDSTVPLLSRDVESTKAAVTETKTSITGIQATVAKVQSDVTEAKGTMVTKAELDAKNQVLQQQFQRVYDNQSKFNEKFQEFQIDTLKGKPEEKRATH
jgi:hypothetical protein